MPDNVDVTAAPSPAPDVAAAPSAVPEPLASPSGEGTLSPTQAQPVVEEARIPLSRLNEVIEQKRAAEAREARLLEALQRSQPQPQPVAQPDFWAGRTDHPDPATAQYWQGQRQMFDLAVQRGKQEAIAELQPVIQAGMSQLAQMSTKEFRRENPEIKVGSEEERQVVAYMNGQIDGVRHPIESAKRNALYDRLETENRALKSKQTLVATKVAANGSESSAGIPATSGLPGQPGNWRENVRQAFRKGGDLAAILNAAGARQAEPER